MCMISSLPLLDADLDDILFVAFDCLVRDLLGERLAVTVFLFLTVDGGFLWLEVYEGFILIFLLSGYYYYIFMSSDYKQNNKELPSAQIHCTQAFCFVPQELQKSRIKKTEKKGLVDMISILSIFDYSFQQLAFYFLVGVVWVGMKNFLIQPHNFVSHLSLFPISNGFTVSFLIFSSDLNIPKLSFSIHEIFWKNSPPFYFSSFLHKFF